MISVVLDNGAVQALLEPDHRKHRVTFEVLDAVRAHRKANEVVRLLVPTAVRAEAGWDRTNPRHARANRLGAVDAPLDASTADLAAGVVDALGVSVAGAHVGAVVRTLPPGDVVVLTSDPGDMVKVCAPRRIRAIRV